MKKVIIFLLMLSAWQSFALSMGDEALELDSKFYNGKVFKAKFYMVDQKNQKKLKIVVFARLLAEDFMYADPLLEKAGKRKGVSLAVATPSEAEIESFLKLKPAFEYPLLSDKKGHDAYMEKNIIYPHAFVINFENRIIWDGELVDLNDMLDKFENGTYDEEKNRKINRHLADMQEAMRNGNEYQLDRSARAVLSLEPGNLACLRMRLFSFENTGRIEEAWKFLEEFRRREPQVKNYYLLQIDLGARYDALSREGSAAGREFISKKLGSNEDRLLLAWMFINYYNFNADALECGEKLLEILKDEKFDDPAQKALFYRASALSCYKRCDIAGAVAQQRLACQIMNDKNDLEILKYYEKLQKK